MVQLECIEEGCLFRTQDLCFENAEKMLEMHIRRQHPAPAPGPGPGPVVPPAASEDARRPLPPPASTSSSAGVRTAGGQEEDRRFAVKLSGTVATLNLSLATFHSIASS